MGSIILQIILIFQKIEVDDPAAVQDAECV